MAANKFVAPLSALISPGSAMPMPGNQTYSTPAFNNPYAPSSWGGGSVAVPDNINRITAGLPPLPAAPTPTPYTPGSMVGGKEVFGPPGPPTITTPMAITTKAPTQQTQTQTQAGQPIYAGQLAYYGNSPTAYAAVMKEKEAAGIPFTHPMEAAAFKKDYPGLFMQAQTVQAPVQISGQKQLPAYVPPEMAAYAPPEMAYQPETQALLKQIQDLYTAPVTAESYPGYQAMQDVSKHETTQASRRALEELNRRGILSSTMAAEQVGQIEQQAAVKLVPALLERAYGLRQDQINQLTNLLNTYGQMGQQEYNRQVDAQRWFYEQQQAQESAKQKTVLDQEKAEIDAYKTALDAEEKQIRLTIDRVRYITGYVDDQASTILGLPAGTPTFEAVKTAQERLDRIDSENIKIDQWIQEFQQKQQDLGLKMATTEYNISRPYYKPEAFDEYQTQDAIRSFLTIPDMNTAMTLFEQNEQNFRENNVDALAVLTALQKKWPGYTAGKIAKAQALAKEGTGGIVVPVK